MHLQVKCLLQRLSLMHSAETLCFFVIMGEKRETLKPLEALKVLLKILDNGTCVMIKGCVGVKSA